MGGKIINVTKQIGKIKSKFLNILHVRRGFSFNGIMSWGHYVRGDYVLDS